MEPVKQFNAALSTMFDHMMQANNELRQQMVELKADYDRLSAERSEALEVLSLHLFSISFIWQLFNWHCMSSD